MHHHAGQREDSGPPIRADTAVVEPRRQSSLSSSTPDPALTQAAAQEGGFRLVLRRRFARMTRSGHPG